MKDWPKPKLVRDIQVFLSFASFYWRFIPSFKRIAAALTSILKITGLPDKPVPSRSISSRNNGSKPTSEKNNGDCKVDRFSGDGVEHAKKSRKSKGKKLAKSQKSSKSKYEKSKKSSKNGNSSNFDTTKTEPSFLNPSAKEAFNCLWLAFTKALILWHFDPECYI